MARVLIPLPQCDFDPTEAAIPWRLLDGAGHTILFSTPDGTPGRADDMMLSGRGLDPWGRVPGLERLILVGRVLRANRSAREAYAAMSRCAAYLAPLRWSSLRTDDFDALLLSGGHRARGMRDYLESEVLQRLVVSFFEAGKPVAAICHGVLLAARSIDPRTGRSVLYGRRTTALTWQFENSAWSLTRRTRFWDPDYYRTYPDGPGEPVGHMSVQAEVTRALAAPRDFLDVAPGSAHYRRKTTGLARDTRLDSTPAFVVKDRNYISARWPGDAHTFASDFSRLLVANDAERARW